MSEPTTINARYKSRILTLMGDEGEIIIDFVNGLLADNDRIKELETQLDEVLDAETGEYETRGNIKNYAVPLLVRDLPTVQQALDKENDDDA